MLDGVPKPKKNTSTSNEIEIAHLAQLCPVGLFWPPKRGPRPLDGGFHPLGGPMTKKPGEVFTRAILLWKRRQIL